MKPLLSAFGLWIAAGVSLWAQPNRPVDVCFVQSDTRILVVCQRSGKLFYIDSDDGEVLGQRELGGRPVCVEPVGESTAIVALRDAGRLALIEIRDQQPVVSGHIDGIRDPVWIEPGPDAKTLYVAGQWSRQVSAIARDDTGNRIAWECSLDFSPGELRYLDAEDTLVAMDAFGSQIAFLEAKSGELRRQVDFYGHRIRGLIDDPDGKRLLVSHQMLNPSAQATTNDITWGMMVSNDLRWLDRETIMKADGDGFYKGGHIDPIGIVGQGGADPNDVVISDDGIVVVPLGGTNQVALGREEDYEFLRIGVGVNPVAVAMDQKGKTVWVANRLDDTLTKIDVPSEKAVKTVALSSGWKLSDAELGERLFHKSTLAHQHWMTCASCHPQGHAINERADNLSDGAFTSPKRVLSLLGRQETGPFGWIGIDQTLHSQVQRSVRTTMRGARELTPRQTEQLVAFVKTFQAPPPVVQDPDDAMRHSIQRGQKVFAANNCASCHKPPFYTSPNLYDVGLEDEIGNTEFNPPSLVGVGQRGPRYFHDLRAESLKAIFAEHQHATEAALSAQDIEDLVTFLKSL